MSLVGERAVNDDGTVAYLANVNGVPATQGLFRTDGTQSTTIASDAVTPPTGGRFTGLLSFAMNNLGPVAFHSEMTAGIGRPWHFPRRGRAAHARFRYQPGGAWRRNVPGLRHSGNQCTRSGDVDLLIDE